MLGSCNFSMPARSGGARAVVPGHRFAIPSPAPGRSLRPRGPLGVLTKTATEAASEPVAGSLPRISKLIFPHRHPVAPAEPDTLPASWRRFTPAQTSSPWQTLDDWRPTRATTNPGDHEAQHRETLRRQGKKLRVRRERVPPRLRHHDRAVGNSVFITCFSARPTFPRRRASGPGHLLDAEHHQRKEELEHGRDHHRPSERAPGDVRSEEASCTESLTSPSRVPPPGKEEDEVASGEIGKGAEQLLPDRRRIRRPSEARPRRTTRARVPSG